MGAIYRNGYKYGDGNGVAQNPVLAIKSGDELYKPENGVAELPDFNEAIEDNAITNTASSTVITLSDAADSNPLALTVYGKSEVVDDAIVSAGEGWATVDLGTLTWTSYTIDDKIYFYTGNMGMIIDPDAGNTTVAPFICAKYITTAFYRSSSGYFEGKTKAIAFGYKSAQRIYIYDPDYTDATAFKNSLNGVILAYQLADPSQGNTIAVKTDNGSGVNGTMAVFETGAPLRGIPNTAVKDSMYWDGLSGEVTKNCGEVDLGTLTWEYGGNGEFYSNAVTAIKVPQLNAKTILCNKYNTVPTSLTTSQLVNNDIMLGRNQRIYIKDTDYTDATDFKTAMNGVKLVYELATPTTQPLTSAEVNAFKQLRTYDPNTVVSNNAGSVMDVRYYKNSTNGNIIKDIDKAVDEVTARLPAEKIDVIRAQSKIDETIGYAVDQVFTGLASFDGRYIWTDGEDIYYSKGSSQYVLDRSTLTWSAKTWTGLTSFDGTNIWTDGENVYYSNNTNQYILNKSTYTWSAKTWNGVSPLSGGLSIWTDGVDIYYSYGSQAQYVLNKNTSTWTEKNWTNARMAQFYANYQWTDGVNIYSSENNNQFIINTSTSSWSSTTWNDNTIVGSRIWTDGYDIYYSKDSTQYVLDKNMHSWVTKIWSGLSSFDGRYVWTDGENIYYSDGTINKRLIPKPKILSVKLR